MLYIYFASIQDHMGNDIINTQFTATAKHSAFLALQFIDNCPPAQGFKIRKRAVTNKEIVQLLNSQLALH